MFSDWYDINKRPDDNWESYEPDVFFCEQGAWELPTVVALYQRLKPQNTVEIGTYMGGTLRHWLAEAKEGATIVSVDLPEVHEQFAASYAEMCPSGVNLKIVTGDSREEATRDRVQEIVPQIDFLYINGDHMYESARADFELYGPLVKPGGVILFHDIVPNYKFTEWGVARLWSEIRTVGYITQELVSRSVQGRYGTGVIYVTEPLQLPG